jgi:hypothetical protein
MNLAPAQSSSPQQCGIDADPRPGLICGYLTLGVLMKTGFVAACFAAAIAVSPGTASAALLTYTETADVSGSLDGVPFTDNELTLKASGDTSGVSGGPSFFFLYVPLTFTLSGGGSGTFTDNETAVIDNQSITLAGFTDFTTGEFALGTLSAVFATYDLRTIIGPVSGGAIFNPGSSFATSAGTLVIRSVSGGATFTATIPEPSTWAMMLLGFAGLGFAGYRASRRTGIAAA